MRPYYSLSTIGTAPRFYKTKICPTKFSEYRFIPKIKIRKFSDLWASTNLCVAIGPTIVPIHPKNAVWAMPCFGGAVNEDVLYCCARFIAIVVIGLSKSGRRTCDGGAGVGGPVFGSIDDVYCTTHVFYCGGRRHISFQPDCACPEQ